jgi:hypothetical protein
MDFHIVKMYKDKVSTKMSKIFFINVWRKSVFDIYFTEFGADLTTVLPVLFKYPGISNQLWDVNTICRRSWYIAAHIWKIYDFKIEVVPFIINFSSELTTVVKFVWVGVSSKAFKR